MYYFIVIILAIIILSIIIPIKVKVKYRVNTKDDFIENIYYKFEANAYILGFLRVIKIETKRKGKVAKSNLLPKIYSRSHKNVHKYLKLIAKEEREKLIENFKIQKLYLNLGINTGDQIMNAYVISFLYFLINFIMSKKIDKVNEKNLNYTINISKKALDMEFDSIIKFKTINTITILIKFIYKLRKVKDKNERRTTTSNRKSNVDSYDINRKYGRC